MTRNAPSRLQLRALVTLFVTLSCVSLTASGAVLYVAPPGRIASWSRWTLLALDRTAWQALHTVLALCFVAAGAFHVWFNWHSLWHYLRSRLTEGVRVRRELAMATAGLAAVVALTVTDAPPFAMIADLGERAKSSWATPESEPPVPHAELLTLERLVATTALPVPLAEGLARLRAYGIEASEVSPMWSLAEAHGRRAHDLVRILAGA